MVSSAVGTSVSEQDRRDFSGPGIWVVPRLPKPAKRVRVPWAAPDFPAYEGEAPVGSAFP